MKVLIALDESEHSQRVLDAAVLRGFPKDSSFRIVHVLERFDPIESNTAVSKEEWSKRINNINEEKQAQASKLVTEAAKAIAKKHSDLEIVTDIREGVPAQQILEVAQDWDADFIIIGARGRRGIQQFLIGSVSYAVLFHAPCTVEIIKCNERSPRNADGTIQRILLALDESVFSSAALEMALCQKWAINAEFRLITVLRPFFEIYGNELSGLSGVNIMEEQEKAVQKKKKFLEEKAQSVVQLSAHLKVSIDVLIGDAREMILKAASDFQADLIIMGSHSREGISKFALGSVSQAVVMHTDCPVQIVKLPKPVAPEHRRQKIEMA